jgi:hypothetical protein
MKPMLGQVVRSGSVYEGRIVSLWAIENEVQAFVQWSDTSGAGWGAPDNIWLISRLIPGDTGEYWHLPKAQH